MYDDEKYRILDLVDMMLDAIQIICYRTAHIEKSDDFLLSPDDMFILDGVCMKLIFIGESIKTVDKVSKGELLSRYPSIPWKEIMKLRDVIAHHYFRIDAEIVYSTIKEDLAPLRLALSQIKQDLQ